MTQKAEAMGNWWLAALSRQHACSCSMSLAEFLAKHQVTQVTQPPQRPDLAPHDFWLFPKLKSPLKGKRFQTIDKIQENMTGHLMATGRTVWGPKVPSLKWTEVSLSCVQCFLYLVSSSINVSIFHITWLDTFWTDLVYEVYEGWDCIFPFPQIFSVLLESFWYNYNKNQKRKREKCFPGVTQEMECVRSQSVAVKKRRGMWVGKSWDWILMLSLPTHEPSRKGLHFSEYQSPSLWNGQVGTSMTWEDWTSLCSWKHLRQCLPHMRCPVQVSCNPFLTSISQMKTLRCKERKGPVQDHTAGLNSRSASNYFWISEQEVTFPLWAELLHLWNE